MVTRRDLITYTSFSMVLSALGFTPAVFAAQGLKLGTDTPFSFEGLIQQAKESAKSPYVAPQQVPDSAVASINYDIYSKVMYKPEYALFNEGVSRFPVTFFSVSNLHKLPVKMAVVENKRAREIIQNADYFIFPDNSQGALSAVKGNVFSGFRVLEHRQSLNKPPVKDWVSFLGASYFRAVGELGQFGVSARGVAINTVFGDTKEESAVLKLLSFEPVIINELIKNSGLPASAITSALTFLEMKGRVKNLGGQQYILTR